MMINRLLQWRDRSLANSFALRSASLAVLSVLTVAVISSAILYSIEREAERSELQHKWHMAADRIEQTVRVVESMLADLSHSSMITTALLDSSGRAAYVRPFLENFSFPVATISGVAVCDINGQLLAGSRSLASCDGDSREFREILLDGKSRHRLIRPADGDRLWTIYQGITFPYSGTTEGVAVARIDLDDLLRSLPGELGIASVNIQEARQPASGTTGTMDDNSFVAPVMIRMATDAGAYELAIAMPQGVFREKLRPMLLGYLMATLVLILVSLYSARHASGLLIKPLIALRDHAQKITSPGNLSLPMPPIGKDEVGQLADSISKMVANLQQAITDQQMAEERFRLIFEKSGEAILFATPDGKISAVNPAACRLYRGSEAELLAAGRAGIMNPDDPRLPAALDERDRTGMFRGELSCRHADGSLFPAEIVSTLFVDSGGTMRTTVMIRDVTAQHEAESERLESALRLNNLSRHLVSVQEEARRRLARELHDTTSPTLAAIGINLEVISMGIDEKNWDQVATRLEDNRGLIEAVASNIRQICSDLRPPALDYAGLSAALESYAHQYSKRTGIAVNFERPVDNPRLSPDTESSLFRIAQESLANTAKHAQASKVDMKLEIGNDHVRLSLADDGQGFDAYMQANQQGQGLFNMREMSEFSGGTFTLQTAEGQGTSIRIDIDTTETTS